MLEVEGERVGDDLAQLRRGAGGSRHAPARRRAAPPCRPPRLPGTARASSARARVRRARRCRSASVSATRSTARGDGAPRPRRVRPMPRLLDLVGLAGDHEDLAGPARRRRARSAARSAGPSRADRPSRRPRCPPRSRPPRARARRACRARRPGGSRRQDERVVAAHHLVGEIEPAGAEVARRVTPSGSARSRQAPRDLAAEAVVPHEGVADAGDQDLLALRSVMTPP